MLLIEYIQFIADEQKLSYEEVYNRCIGKENNEAYFDIKMRNGEIYNGCMILKESNEVLLVDWIGEGELKFIAIRRNEINRIGFSDPNVIEIYLDALDVNNDGVIDLFELEKRDLL